VFLRNKVGNINGVGEDGNSYVKNLHSMTLIFARLLFIQARP